MCVNVFFLPEAVSIQMGCCLPRQNRKKNLWILYLPSLRCFLPFHLTWFIYWNYAYQFFSPFFSYAFSFKLCMNNRLKKKKVRSFFLKPEFYENGKKKLIVYPLKIGIIISPGWLFNFIIFIWICLLSSMGFRKFVTEYFWLQKFRKRNNWLDRTRSYATIYFNYVFVVVVVFNLIICLCDHTFTDKLLSCSH